MKVLVIPDIHLKAWLFDRDVKTIGKHINSALKEDGNQSTAGLAEIAGFSQRTVQRTLRRLMDEGKIEHVGSNRFGHYVIK